MYKYRNELEDKNIAYKIIREKFLNYRQLNFKLLSDKTNVIPAYALSYSTLARKKAQGVVEFSHNNISYFNREEIKFVTLEFFNSACSFKYRTVNELIFNPPSFDEELKFRTISTSSNYDLTPIIIVDKIPQTKLTVELDAKIYEDVREKLIIL
ncbi:MAG: hypothetical protein A3E21_09380 [Sulfurimonas sp. RIFCSPHIGHO2_12_FULL_36_9]|nr:MAG: hypothetical protein A3E21_09380 [Sulfurimonas sp. RIFCSPHIGHO2_12_FULL_36_9]